MLLNLLTKIRRKGMYSTAVDKRGDTKLVRSYEMLSLERRGRVLVRYNLAQGTWESIENPTPREAELIEGLVEYLDKED